MCKAGARIINTKPPRPTYDQHISHLVQRRHHAGAVGLQFECSAVADSSGGAGDQPTKYQPKAECTPARCTKCEVSDNCFVN